VQVLKSAGHSDADVMEIVLEFAPNTLTNRVNNVAQTEIDIRAAEMRRTA
jgi:hypothetical protein